MTIKPLIRAVNQSHQIQSAEICLRFVGKIARFPRGDRACNWSRIRLLLRSSVIRGDDRMRIVLQLVTRLLLVVVLCLVAATVWATIDAYHSVDRATAASAQRVSQALQTLYWQEVLLRSNIDAPTYPASPGMADRRNHEVYFAGDLHRF